MPTMTALPLPVLAAGSGGLATGYLILLIVIGVALLALFIGAVVSILSSPALSGSTKFLWIVVCLILQFFGPVAWFLWGRKAFAEPA